MKSRVLIVAGLIAVLAGGPACTATRGTEVTGKIIVPKSSAFPVGSTLTIRITDVDSWPPAVLAEKHVTIVPGWEAPSTHPPVEFVLPYPAEKVDVRHTYVLSAEVTRGKDTLASSTATTKVITKQAPIDGIELPVGGP